MFTWVLVFGFIFAFVVAFGIGANDVANSFGTVYGTKVLSVFWIVVIASICEFLGALLLGAEVSKTIGGAIANLDNFVNQPYLFMYGMLSTLIATGLWLIVATFSRLPVSTTHSTVGGVMGFALAAHGINGVTWAVGSDDFPFVKGFVPILISWLISPVLAGAVAAGTFALLRIVILRADAMVDLKLDAIVNLDDDDDDDDQELSQERQEDQQQQASREPRQPHEPHETPQNPPSTEAAAPAAAAAAAAKLKDDDDDDVRDESPQPEATVARAAAPAASAGSEEESPPPPSPAPATGGGWCAGGVVEWFMTQRASIIFGVIVFVTIWVNAFFIFSKGMKNRIAPERSSLTPFFKRDR